MMDLSDAITPACMENPYYNDSGRQSQPKTRARPLHHGATESRRRPKDRWGPFRIAEIIGFIRNHDQERTRHQRSEINPSIFLSFGLLRDSVAPWCKGLAFALNLTSALSSASPSPARLFHACR